MNRHTLQFDTPRKVSVAADPVPAPAPGEVLAESCCSAISSGTELLAYRGELPGGMALDTSISGMQEVAQYPLRYGYCNVMSVIACGDGVSESYLGRRAFAFQPHTSHCCITPEQLVFLPENVAAEDAAFLANMETAVGLLMDGAPLIGERVLVIGLGVVGLLTAALLARRQDVLVDGLDLQPARRAWAHSLGVRRAMDPDESEAVFQEQPYDLVYELSGSPAGMQTALDAAGYAGRIVVGSWYGSKPVSLALGERFHRSKVQIYASQVSKLDPKFSGRWTKSRRLDVAINCLEVIRPSRLITHEFSIHQAEKAYALLDEPAGQNVLQVLFRYPQSSRPQ